MSEHHRHHRRRSRVSTLLREYLVEIIAAVVVVLGIFLLLEPSIRSTLLRWAMTGMQGVLHALGRLGEAVAVPVTRLTPTGLLGVALIFLAVVAAVLRLRWRLTRSASLTAIRCPRCSGAIHRVHRRWGDRVVSWFVPVRRYRCSNSECRWCGIRVASGQHDPEPTAPAP
jgi:hypothetical protein